MQELFTVVLLNTALILVHTWLLDDRAASRAAAPAAAAVCSWNDSCDVGKDDLCCHTHRHIHSERKEGPCCKARVPADIAVEGSLHVKATPQHEGH